MFISGLLLTLGHIAWTAVGASLLVSLVTDKFIDDKTIKDTAKNRHASEQLKLLIKDKNTRKVKVGIFDNPTDKHLEDMNLETSKGVSDSLYVGQVLYV